jgi:phenylalanyl-tRNA synthetase alpha chain
MRKGRGKGFTTDALFLFLAPPAINRKRTRMDLANLALEQLVTSAQSDFGAAQDAAALENAKAKYLGKTGQVTELMKGLGKLDPDQRKAQGALINAAKEKIEQALTARREDLANAQLLARLNAEAIDVTLPGRGRSMGGIHPVMRTWERVEQIFRSIGFDVADGPEIETDWTNFTALNSPENHPARSMQDTFYIEGNDSTGKPLLLRTHTSPMQVR